MTKSTLAQLVYEHVDNGQFMGLDKDEIIDGISSLLDALHPNDIERFAKWGYPAQQSTPEECWK